MNRESTDQPNSTRRTELLVGLGEVTALEVTDTGDGLRVMIETRAGRPRCPQCKARAVNKDRDMGGARKPGCESFTERAPAIAAPRLRITDRAAGVSRLCREGSENRCKRTSDAPISIRRIRW